MCQAKKIKTIIKKHMPQKISIRNTIQLALIVATILIIYFSLKHSPPGAMGIMRAIGYSVCHQIPSHTYKIGSLDFPMCSRCMGMYIGNLVGFAFLFSQGKKGGLPSKGYLAFFGLLVLAWLVDGSNSYINSFLGKTILFTSTNPLRLITGFGMGLTMALAIFLLFNQIVWRKVDSRSPFQNQCLLPGMLISSGILSIIILDQNEIFMTILAYLSTTMVVILLTLLYSVVWMIILHKENSIYKIKEMFFLLNVGFFCAILQIILLDAARYYLTGSWASLGI